MGVKTEREEHSRVIVPKYTEAVRPFGEDGKGTLNQKTYGGKEDELSKRGRWKRRRNKGVQDLVERSEYY